MTALGKFSAQIEALWRQPLRFLRVLIGRDRKFRVPAGRKNNLVQNGNGAALVELAVTLPILLGFVFGLMQVCLAYYTYEYISELAREGTRYAALHGPTCETSSGSSCAAVAEDVNDYVAGLGWPNIGGATFSESNVSTTYPNGYVAGQPVVVTVTYTFPYKIPFVMSQPLSLTSSSQMTILQ
jgi:Flp pilus assembly protein TadG